MGPRIKIWLVFVFLLVLVILTGSPSRIGASSATKVIDFSDNFESYEEGENPTDVYDYWAGTNYRWSPVPLEQPDRYKVGLLDGNKVLKYDFEGPSIHFPFASKLYKQSFAECLEAGVTFLYTEPVMGWGALLFCYQGDSNFYSIQTMYDNTLQIYSRKSGKGSSG